jgi:pre-rRNA-processing protein IPI3
MLTESILASIGPSTISKSGPASTLPIIKDAGIFNLTLRPHFNPKTTFKKSSAQPNSVAVSDNHVFAAQADKAVVHVYAKEKGNQELTVPFGEKVTAVATAGEGGVWVVCGTESGGVLVWEVSFAASGAFVNR